MNVFYSQLYVTTIRNAKRFDAVSCFINSSVGISAPAGRISRNSLRICAEGGQGLVPQLID